MIFTSYFSKASKVPDAIKISIALSKPDFFRADATIPVFAPTYEILSEYKRTGNAEVYKSPKPTPSGVGIRGTKSVK